MDTIICIVKNDSNDNSRGLIHAFNKETNAFIEKYFYEETTVFSTLFGNQTRNKYLLINQNLVIPKNEPPSEQEAWDILLVCDNLDETAVRKEEIKEIKQIPLTPQTLVMYHQYPKLVNEYFKDLQNNNIIRKCKEGHHEPNPKDGYQLLLELTKAWNGTEFESQAYTEAKEKLIKWFGLNEKLNKALEFLHKLLGGTPADISILKNGDEKFNLLQIYKKEKIEKKLEDWIKDLKGKNGDEYNNALAIVRDALLEQAGVTGEN